METHKRLVELESEVRAICRVLEIKVAWEKIPTGVADKPFARKAVAFHILEKLTEE